MHGVVFENLEEYLSGALEPAGCREVEAHLLNCAGCRDEVAGMQEMSGLFGSLRTDEAMEPSLGFYAGVMRQAKAKAPTPAFGGPFGLDLAFGRRLVFASLVTLAVLGGFLVARERQTFSAPAAETVIAEETSPAFNSESVPAQDKMLVTLAAYER